MFDEQVRGSPVNGELEVSAVGEDQLRLQRFLGKLGASTQQLIAQQFEKAAEAGEEVTVPLPLPSPQPSRTTQKTPNPYYKPRRLATAEDLRNHEVRLLEKVKEAPREDSAVWAERALTGLVKVGVVKKIKFTKGDIRIYQMVYRSVLDEHQERGLSLSTALTFMHGFVVQDAIAGALGLCQRTVWRAFRKFEKAGVLASATKYTGIIQDEEKVDRAEGTVVNMLVRPELALEGHRIWVRAEHLRRSYRNLTKDIEEGRTAFKMLSGTHHLQKRRPKTENDEAQEEGGAEMPKCHRHLQWKKVDEAYPLFRSFLQEIVKGRKKKEEVKTYRTFMFADLKNLSRRAMTERLKDLAEKLAQRLSDQHSVNSYLRIFWRATRLYWEGQNHLEHAQQALEATLKDMQHSKVTKPGALFRHHLSVRGLECLLT